MATQAITAAPAPIEGSATAKYIRVSPQKARLVVDLIRGRRAEQALATLQFTRKRVAREIEKALRSAIANAQRKADDAGESLDVDRLYVTRCFINEGPRLSRLRPAPFGRAFRYHHRTSHIVVAVTEHEAAAAQRTAESVRAAAEAKGVKGAVRKARKALRAAKQPAKKKKKG
jgi:large subunit ribosomal protein L22